MEGKRMGDKEGGTKGIIVSIHAPTPLPNGDGTNHDTTVWQKAFSVDKIDNCDLRWLLW